MVIPPEDAAALADKIRRCLADGAALDRMGANGRKALLAEFDRPIAARRFEDALAEPPLPETPHARL